KNSRPLQCLTQRLAVRLDDPRWIVRYHAAVLRETTIDQLRSEANVADLGANVICTHREVNIAVRTQDALQLKYALAWNDHLVRVLRLAAAPHSAQREPVTVRCDGAQRLADSL